MKSWFLFLLFSIASQPIRGSESDADATAKFLAGLPVLGTSLESRSLERPWATHATELDKIWNRFDQNQLSKIQAWDPQFLGDYYADTAPVFYMFSGPDFLYPSALFPSARTYILCGKEPVGPIPDLDKLSQSELPKALQKLRRSLDSILSWSFFITEKMKTDLSHTQLNGTLPVLYVFLARTGATIDSVSMVSLDADGNVADNGKTKGVRIDFANSRGGQQTLYYFCTDLSDDGIKREPGFMKFCESQAPGLTLLKAASYLMHRTRFPKVRDFLLNCSKVIVQDDSGIPEKFFDPNKWNVRFCGKYAGPIRRFRQYWQPDLARSFAAAPPIPLSFGFGYEWRPNKSSLIIATQKTN